jgi:hypothetical protein
MSAGGETGSCHNRGEALKPGAGGLFQAIKRAPKTTNHAIKGRVPWRRLHVNLLTQFTIEKYVLNIKMRHRPVANRCHNKKSAHSGHMSHGCKGLMTLLLLEATSHKTRFVALKRSIKASLNLVDPLTCDGMNTGRWRDKIPSASALRRSNLLGYGKLPFEMALSIPIRNRLEGNRKTIVTRRVAIRGTTLMGRKRRSHLSRGRSHIRRRRSIRDMRATRIMERKRRQHGGGWRVRRERRTRWGGGWRWERWSIIKEGTRRRINRHRGWCIGKQQERYVLHREGRRGGSRVVGTRLIKLDITRNAHPTANWVRTPIALVLITVAKKHTLKRLSGLFGALTRGQKNIANAPERAKSRKIRGASKQTL